jgi:CHAT domain-containing protein
MPSFPQILHRATRNSCVARSLASPSCWAVSILVLATASSCSRRHDPQLTFNRAVQALQHGDLTSAGSEAEKGYKEFKGTGADWAWKFTILRARVKYWRGLNAEVLSLLESEPQPPPDGDLSVQKLKLEAVAHASLHQFSEAEHEIGGAEKLCAANYPACQDLDSTRAKLEMEKGHYQLAGALFERALSVHRANGDQYGEAMALLGLSWSADEQTHFDAALDWAASAGRISIRHDFAGIAGIALGNAGWAYYKLGDPEKAEEMFTGARGQAALLGNEVDEAVWLQASGYIAIDQNKITDADHFYQESLDLARRISSKEQIINSLIALAFVSEQTNKLDDAKRYADEALSMARADGNGRDVVYPLLVEGRVAADRKDPTTAEANFRDVAKSPDTPVFLKWEAERSLARLYEDENHPEAADAEYRTALTTFEAARCDLHQRVDSRLPFLSNAARIYEDYIHFLVTGGKTRSKGNDDALRVADYTRARTLAEGLGRPCTPKFAPDPLNATEIARRAGGTILFYALGHEHSYLWAITPHQVRMFPLAANQAEIDTAVENYRKKLEGPREILEASNDGSVLYQMLVAPAAEVLKQEARAKNTNVFIVPDGALNSLNFETLLPQTSHYWIEDVTIANAASLRLLPVSRSNSRNLSGKLLLMGNPLTPDAGTDNPYPELPNAAAQMESIEKYFPSEQQTVLARADATPHAYLKNRPEQFSYIHFVAHGTASRMNPLDSAIILSREANSNAAASQDDSFKLYARDIIATRPLHADLVTISACYSTGNRTYSGEGLVGLSWAFLRAGAHNVVAALWDVSDASTPQLVDKFYAGLKNGKTPADALRQAKLSLLHSDTFHSPFYWAPFQLYTGS